MKSIEQNTDGSQTMSWKEFKARIETFVSQEIKFSTTDSDGNSRVLFRGHGNSRWTLQTTLERSGHPEMPLSKYLMRCATARRYISNYLPSEIPFDENLECGYQRAITYFPNYEYLGFLRHHGFPSPLLDWTESPYVAAFFAFRHIHPDAECVRIYLYKSNGSSGRCWDAGKPSLFSQGPFAAIHERHAAQQCWYTVALKCESDDSCLISPHQAAFDAARNGVVDDQDIIEVCDIPVSERTIALADLFSMNVNPFTLFRSPEALMETAALRLL